MNIASALLKQLVHQQDLETWSQLKDIYLPSEYQGIYKVLDKHVDAYQALPTFEELQYEIRDKNLTEKLTAIELMEVDVDADMLLDYLKNEFTQTEILDEIIPRFTALQVFQAVLESFASEHASRMVAMKNATDNANQIIKDLTLEYNKIRQASITSELLEITTAQMSLG